MMSTGSLSVSDYEMRAFVRAVYKWAVIVAIFSLGQRYLNKSGAVLSWLTPAVYPLYILHQTVIIVAWYWLAPMGFGPVVEPVLLVTLTFGVPLLMYEYIIRRVTFLRPLFGLKMLR